ncbi:MAG: hypothetical protein MJ142_02580 [Clostridia bacterium]|nr:hypothetical protein [Clostridia bacterium]
MCKKPWLTVFCGTLICLILFVFLTADTKPEDTYAQIEKSLDTKFDELSNLVSTYQGAYFDKNNDEFILFADLFDADLISVDLRGPDNAVFSFCTSQLETGIELIFRADDYLMLLPGVFLEKDMNELRVDGLGINQSGYIFCKRIKQCWFYYEIFIPT